MTEPPPSASATPSLGSRTDRMAGLVVRFLGPAAIVAAVLVAGVALALPAFQLRIVSTLTVVGATIAVTLFAYRSRVLNGRLVFEPPLLIVLVFFVWHFSFWAVHAVGLSSSYRLATYARFPSDTTQFALLVSLAGLLALIGGLAIGTGRNPWRPVPTASATTLIPYAVPIVGAILMTAYFAFWGWELVGDYQNVFLDEDPPRRLFNLGVVLVLPSIAALMHFDLDRRRRAIVLALTAGPALLISAAVGSRWIPFTAILLALVALSMKGVRLGYGRLLLIGVVLAFVATALKELRRDLGAAGSLPALLFDRHTNPVLEFVEELGQAFVAVAGTIDMETGGYATLWGRSFVDAALSVVPSLPQLVGRDVVRPSHELASAYFEPQFTTEGYTIGYSVVADLYLNFGVLGVVVGLSLAGFAFGRLYRLYLVDGTYRSLFVTYALLSFVLFGMRNDLYTWLRGAVWASILFAVIGWQLDRGSDERESSQSRDVRDTTLALGGERGRSSEPSDAVRPLVP